MATGPGRPRKPGTREVDRRRHRHAHLKNRAKAGKPGAAEELRRFRLYWARELARRADAATNWMEEDQWSRMAAYWLQLANGEGEGGAKM